MNILATKLMIPQMTANHIPRAAIMDKMTKDGFMKRQVTLVCAPAGYGKTTLELINVLGDSCAWLSLDEGDNDASRFIAYIMAAFKGGTSKQQSG